jgi:catechol 2,3-dioxygenase-like lactoylglutathione lyase family enzyme
MAARAHHPLHDQLTRFSTMLVVSDLERSERFYTGHLGFSTVERLEGVRLLELGPVRLYLVIESPPTPDKPGVTLAPPRRADGPPVNLVFHVRDVRATHRALEAGGMRFLTPPAQPPWGGWRVFAQDPDGYLIEIEQAA